MEKRKLIRSLCSITILTLIASGMAPGQKQGADREFEKAKSFRADSRFDSALVHFEIAARLAAGDSSRERYYECIVEIIAEYARIGQLQRADTLAEQTEGGMRRELGENHAVLAELYFMLGYLRSYENRSEEAIGYVTRGLTIRKSFNIPNDLRVAAGQYSLGLAYRRVGNLDAAFKALEIARKIQEIHRDQRGEDLATTLAMIGYTFDQNSEPSKALEKYAEASSIYSKLKLSDSPSAAICEHYRAMCYRSLGRFEESIACEQRALSITRRCYGEKSLMAASILGQLGDHLAANGDLETAMSDYHEALEIARGAVGNTHSTTLAFEKKIALVHASRGEFDKALEIVLRVIPNHAAAFGANNRELGELYKDVADMYRGKGELPTASAYYAKALTVRKGIPSSGERLDIAGLLQNMGCVFLARGYSDSAASYLQRSLDIQESSHVANRRLTSSTYESLAELNNARGAREAALKMYQRALIALCPDFTDTSVLSHPEVPRQGYGRDYVRLMAAKAATILQRRDGAGYSERLSAFKAYCLASNALERLRRSYRSEQSKLALQESVHAIYESGMRVALRLFRETGENEYREAAFAFAERSRGAVLLESLQEAHPAHYAGVPDQLIDRENGSRRELAALEIVMEQSEFRGDSAAASRTRKLILAKNREIDQLEDSLAERDKRFSTMAKGNRTAPIGEVANALEPGACLIEYSVCSDSVLIFVIQNGRSDIVVVKRPADLDSLTNALRRSLRTMDGDAFRVPARSLYALLIEPIAAQLLTSVRLVIVPDGTLHYIPFEVLIGPESASPGKNANGSHLAALPYLVRTYEISYAVSGTLFCEDKKRTGGNAPDGDSFAGFAPVFRDSITSTTHSIQGYLGRLDLAALRSITADGRRFSELPFSEDEVKNIADAFNATGRRGMSVINSDATEESFKENSSRHTVLHVATHAYIDEQHPGLSALLFTPRKDSSSLEDGILYAGEVYGMNLHADLVVLSCCESGMGKLVRGEGLMTMTRGFLYAGARNILYSLWKVHDKHASELMQRFYAHMLAGETLPGALRGAKLEMIGHDATAHPFKWAGFALMGE